MPSQKRVKIAGLTLPPPPLVFALQSLSSPSGWCFFSLPPPHSGAASFCQYIPVPNLFYFSLILSTFYYQPNVYLLLLGNPRSTNECNFPELSSVNSESFGTFTSCMSQFFWHCKASHTHQAICATSLGLWLHVSRDWS